VVIRTGERKDSVSQVGLLRRWEGKGGRKLKLKLNGARM